MSTGRPLPAPVTLTAADTPAGSVIDGLERFEGMRVRVASLGVVAPTTGPGVFYGVVAGVARPFREAGLDVHDGRPFDAPDTVPLFDANLERLRVDSAALGLAPIDVATGTVITELVGPLHYGERTYTILVERAPGVTPGPASAATAALPLPRATEFTTATLNADRLFDAIDSPDHDDVVVTSAALTVRLAKLSRQIRYRPADAGPARRAGGRNARGAAGAGGARQRRRGRRRAARSALRGLPDRRQRYHRARRRRARSHSPA